MTRLWLAIPANFRPADIHDLSQRGPSSSAAGDGFDDRKGSRHASIMRLQSCEGLASARGPIYPYGELRLPVLLRGSLWDLPGITFWFGPVCATTAIGHTGTTDTTIIGHTADTGAECASLN